MSNFLYLAVTSEGYWGKGETAQEALKEANIGNTYRRAYVAKADKRFIDSLYCTDSGGYGYTMSKKLFEINENNLGISSHFITLTSGDFRLVKNEITVKNLDLELC